MLLSRPERISILLQAIEGGVIQPGELTTAQVKFLRNHSNARVRQLATKILGATTVNKRQEVIDAYQSALQLAGDAAKGKEVYLKLCASCHRLGGNGYALGPDLVTVKNTGKEKMLVNILDPNREVAPNYLAFEIETKDGESAVGMIASESTSSITVRQAFGKENVILRSDMKSRRSLGQSLYSPGFRTEKPPGEAGFCQSVGIYFDGGSGEVKASTSKRQAPEKLQIEITSSRKRPTNNSFD